MKKEKLIIFLALILFLGLLSIYYPDSKEKSIKEEYEKQECYINRVIDGDTLVCDNQTIRLLGINTPEKGKFYYQEAKDFLGQFNGEKVSVLRDFDDSDKYKRKLRYIFYNDRMINIEILEKGFGVAFMHENLRYESKFIDAENYAKKNCAGVWEKECKN